MGILELLLIAVGLSMDAFAVSICKGLSLRTLRFRDAAITGGYFGVFQAVMPLAGYFLGIQFASVVESVDHWLAFILLGLIGGKMVWDSCKARGDEGEGITVQSREEALGFRNMLPLAVATSIDALAIGVSFAFLQVDILPAVLLIGATTFLLSMGGVKIGHVFGLRFQSKAEFAGGLLLILMGVKILLEHTGIL